MARRSGGTKGLTCAAVFPAQRKNSNSNFYTASCGRTQGRYGKRSLGASAVFSAQPAALVFFDPSLPRAECCHSSGGNSFFCPSKEGQGFANIRSTVKCVQKACFHEAGRCPTGIFGANPVGEWGSSARKVFFPRPPPLGPLPLPATSSESGRVVGKGKGGE